MICAAEECKKVDQGFLLDFANVNKRKNVREVAVILKEVNLKSYGSLNPFCSNNTLLF